MKKSMEADIRAQLEANMAMMNNNASTWEERVCIYHMYYMHFISRETNGINCV